MHVYEKYSTRVCVEGLIQNEVKPSAVFSLRYPRLLYTSIGGALSVILYFLVVLFGVTFSSSRIAAIFTHQDVIKCL